MSFQQQSQEIIRDSFYVLFYEEVRVKGYSHWPRGIHDRSDTNLTVSRSLQRLARKFIESHREQTMTDLENLNLEHLQATFLEIAHGIFSDSVNWSRVIALVSFSVLLAVKLHHSHNLQTLIESIVVWLVDFVNNNLKVFIENQDSGWESIISFEVRATRNAKAHSSTSSSSWLSYFAGVGAIGLGAFIGSMFADESSKPALSSITTTSPLNYDKWLEEGYVDLTITRINMHGPPGAGKTCAQHLLLNEDPPTNADSTPIARPAVKATKISSDSKDEDNIGWDKVERKGMTKKLASHLKADLDLQQQKQHRVCKQLTKSDSTTGGDQSIQPHTADSTPTDSIPSAHSTSNTEPKDETDHYDDKEDSSFWNEIEAAISNSKGAELNHDWIYMIDSGGQPAYQELLPLFVRAASVNIITIDLSKGLDERLQFEYRIGGKIFSCDSRLKYTNRKFIKHTVYSKSISFKPIDIPHLLETPSYPSHLILGTHLDKITPPTLREMNTQLMKESLILESFIPNTPRESIIFPVNSMLPSQSEERKKAGNVLRHAISKCASLKIRVPIRWFFFELLLQDKRETDKRYYFTKQEVLSIGRRLKMDKDDTEQALQYLHNVTIILYYPQVLPNIVFVDPQPILNVLSQILALTYVFPGLITRQIPSKKDLDKLIHCGLFKINLFSNLKVENLFSTDFNSSDLINLLKHLYIIADINEGDTTANTEQDYFLPCTLPSYYNHCDLNISNPDIKPLCIVWKNEDMNDSNCVAVPQGVFPLTIVHLLKNKNIIYPPFKSDDYYRYRDALSLRITIDKRYYTLHLINRYEHIELHFIGSCKDMCPTVKEIVISAIRDSCNDIGVKDDFIEAFPCERDEHCYCEIVDTKHKIVNCSLCPMSDDIIDDSYWCWFKMNTENCESSMDIDNTDSSMQQSDTGDSGKPVENISIISSLATTIPLHSDRCESALLKHKLVLIEVLSEPIFRDILTAWEEKEMITSGEARSYIDRFTGETLQARVTDFIQSVQITVKLMPQSLDIFLDILYERGNNSVREVAERIRHAL